jgi:hypothetical protein
VCFWAFQNGYRGVLREIHHETIIERLPYRQVKSQRDDVAFPQGDSQGYDRSYEPVFTFTERGGALD